MPLTSILNYSDFRLFLKDYYLEKKKANSPYSYRQFAIDLGFQPSNYLHLVIRGKRNLSLESIEKIKETMEWNARENNYFHALVHYNQLPESPDKKKWGEEIEAILKKQRAKISPDQFDYFTKWHYPVIREIAALPDFVSSLNWISKKLRPRISEEEVKKALMVLERLNLVKREGTKWVQTKKDVATDAEVISDVVYRYHQELLRLSLSALNHPANERDISAMTMSMGREQFDRLKQKIISFRDEVQQELQQKNSHSTLVAQLNIQFFKVTEE